jgi:hypothetical protein
LKFCLGSFLECIEFSGQCQNCHFARISVSAFFVCNKIIMMGTVLWSSTGGMLASKLWSHSTWDLIESMDWFKVHWDREWIQSSTTSWENSHIHCWRWTYSVCQPLESFPPYCFELLECDAFNKLAVILDIDGIRWVDFACY